jgi:hypothetical protein
MMEDTLVLEKTETLVARRKRTIQGASNLRTQKTVSDHVSVNLSTEGGESFSNYINLSELKNDSNVLVLSPKHHYYYDVDELKGITTLINLKRLNFMNHLESFLHVVGDILSPNAKFIGCFADLKTQKRGGLRSRMYKRIITFLDGRTDMPIDKNNLMRIFESCGFGIIDMTEINGLTYFTTTKCVN